MGCDIHMYVEMRKDGQWVTADYFLPTDSDFDNRPERSKEAQLYVGDYHMWHPVGGELNHIPIYDCRSYWLFGILAGVRGEVDDENSPTIDEPRGLPDDICPFVKAEYGDGEWDWHTPSWFTLKELAEYDARYPNQEFSNLKNLIRKLKDRADDLYLIYNFEWDHGRIPAKANDLRIVFLFDN